MKLKGIVLGLISCTAAGLNLPAADVNALLAQWNVITSGNLNLVNDIGGCAYIGGELAVPNSFTTASIGSSAIPVNAISLAVGGNIDSGGNIQVNGGSVVVGGTIAGSRTINLNSHGTVTQGDPAALPSSPVSQIASASQYWSTLAANSSTTVANNGQLDFNCSATTSMAVFNLSASRMFGSGYQGFTLNPSAVTGDVLINVKARVSIGLPAVSSASLTPPNGMAGCCSIFMTPPR